MFYRPLEFFVHEKRDTSLPIQAWRPAGLEAGLARLTPPQAAFLRASGFLAKPGQCQLIPGSEGVAGAVLGLGDDTNPDVYSVLPVTLPSALPWHLEGDPSDWAAIVIGYAMGAYAFDFFRQAASPATPQLYVPNTKEIARALKIARAIWLVRDLINMPANALGPGELARNACSIMQDLGAAAEMIAGEQLVRSYPLVHAVGAASARSPAIVVSRWQGSTAEANAPLISLCGKGVCFDSGGYDLKPPAGMLRMKKDMGGAAIALGLACLIITENLPVRLELRLGCVENMVSGNAMRPLDIVRSRSGLFVEIGNTDAEGRLVLADLLDDACESAPDLVLNFATLTGAARVALGPELPALFSNNDDLANALLKSGAAVYDPLWRLPLWSGYNSWLEGGAGDLNNFSEKTHAGAILAALFLQRFIRPGIAWGHIDVYAWNDSARSGRPQGGEAQAMRAAFEMLREWADGKVPLKN